MLLENDCDIDIVVKNKVTSSYYKISGKYVSYGGLNSDCDWHIIYPYKKEVIEYK